MVFVVFSHKYFTVFFCDLLTQQKYKDRVISPDEKQTWIQYHSERGFAGELKSNIFLVKRYTKSQIRLYHLSLLTIYILGAYKYIV